MGRPMGPLENYFQLLMDKYNVSVYVQIFIVNSTHELAATDVQKALEILSEYQEAMHMRILPIPNEQHTFRFAEMEQPIKVDIRTTTINYKSDWPLILLEENDLKFDCHNGPLWRVTWAKVENIETNEDDTFQHQYVIVMVLHHAIADAHSVFDLLYRQFLPILSALVNDMSLEGIVCKVPLAKSTEELFSKWKDTSKPYVLPWYFKVIFGLIRWKNRNFGATNTFNNHFYYPNEKKVTLEESKALPFCNSFIVNENLTSAVIHSARRNKVTVHSIFVACTSIALSATVKEAGMEFPAIIKQNWPIDLRKYLGMVSPQPLCSLNSVGNTDTENKDKYNVSEFWKLCKEIYRGIQKQTPVEKATAVLGAVQYFIDASKNEPINEVIDEFGLMSVAIISNPGNLDLGPTPKMTPGKIRLEGVEQYFSTLGMMRVNASPFFHSVTTFKGKIAWNTTYNTMNVSKKFMNTYQQKIQELFNTFCGDTPV